jgi:H+/Cl- antiporter ClcA
VSLEDEKADRAHDGGEPARNPILRSRVLVELRAQLALPVLVVGVIGGAIGAAYVTALNALLRWIGPGDHSVLLQTAILVAAGALVTIGTRLLGESGNVELLVDNIHVLGGTDDVRRLRSLVPTSLICIGAGGSMGPEAPLVQTSGTFGTWLASRLALEADGTRILTITGMAAGFSVLFGAPLGAALFALEILHRRGLQYYEALVPALIGSLVGYAANVGLTGMGLEPLWQLPPMGPLRATDLGWAVVCGLIGTLGAILFTVAASVSRRLVCRIPPALLPAIGGLALGALFFWSPFALTNGEGQVELVVAETMTVAALAVAIVAKFVGVMVTISARWKGGFIIPLFFMGIAGGQLLHLVFPSTNATVMMAALAVALCVGVTKTPLGSTLAVTQMAGLPLLPMSLIAAVIALLLTSGSSMIDTQRERTSNGNEQ